MNNGTMNGNGMEAAAPRLPQIDPVTFSALNTLDTFVARAPLTRAEHAEASKAVQHLVQTVELLQAAVRAAHAGCEPHGPMCEPHGPMCEPHGRQGGQASGARVHEGTAPRDESTIVAEAAEEIFNKSRT